MKNGYWHMILSYKEPSGKRKTKSISTHLKERGNKKRAEEMLLELRRRFSVEFQGISQPTEITFALYMEEWLRQIEPTVAPTTFATYSYVVKSAIIPYFQERSTLLSQLKPKHIEGYYDTLLTRGLSPTTVLRHHANIRKALQKAVTLELIPSNPADRVTRPRKADYLAGYYSVEDATALLRAVTGSILEIPVTLGLFYGLRRSEVLGLRWEAIDFENHVIRIIHSVTQIEVNGKTSLVARDILKRKSSYRTLPMPPAIDCLLKARRKASGYVCLDESEKILVPDNLSRGFSSMLEKSGLRKIRFHDLRHTCATFLINAQIPLIEVQQWLGHSTISTTADLYSHLQFTSKLRSAEILNRLLTNKKKEEKNNAKT
ncbi:tyrosine-type recombinase/integrase [Sporobacter termitidis]|uniref:tyrosine-type recombinase/integrase n=1 Tax=Sporobacter termitidis TaxID=44749 RepID=UPI00135654B6|nr:site-specific integrase [Sporobacter termitidis]